MIPTPAPVSTTTEHDDLILRFLRAASDRIVHHGGRVPFNTKEGHLVLNWLGGLVGKINKDGSVS